MSKEIFLRCDCYSHGMLVNKDDEYNHTEFCLFTIDSTSYSFIRRIKWCFRMLFKGRPFTDHVILTDESCEKLADFLKK